MSFSSDVKKELLAINDNARHCQIAMLSAIINICGVYNGENIILSSENSDVIDKAYELIKTIFNVELNKSNSYKISVADKIIVNNLVNMLDLSTDDTYSDYVINPMVVSSSCCKRAYIRGAFICSGSVTDPEKNYHLEFSNTDYDHCVDLKKLIQSFGIEAKIVERKNHYVLYIKEGEQIVDMLNIMSAHKALMELENVRIVKDLRNNLNRIVNCETANINKVVSASVRQINAIEYIRATVGLSYLTPQLQEMARVRLQYPDMSLKELGTKLSPPVGKSGVNHRLSKIIKIEQQLKGEI